MSSVNTVNSHKIIYLPGFNSGPQSEKSAQLQARFPNVIVPVYDSWNPDHGFAQIDRVVQASLPGRLLLVGSSLGGFWAYQFACRYHLPCMLINPCMSPEITLRSSLGRVENFYTHISGQLTAADLDKYAGYRSQCQPQDIVVLHEQGDELIPYQESIENFSGKARLILPEGGNHRFSRIELILEVITAWIAKTDINAN